MWRIGGAFVKIRRILENKREFLPLLLLGDEQEDMIGRYLDRGTLFALYDGGTLRTVCVVTAEGGGVYEVKNLATAPESQRQGYGQAMLDFVIRFCRGQGGKRLLVGTGDSPLTLPFYHACGFQESFRVPGFFTANYDHPIFEGGRQLQDMVYLEMDLT